MVGNATEDLSTTLTDEEAEFGYQVEWNFIMNQELAGKNFTLYDSYSFQL